MLQDLLLQAALELVSLVPAAFPSQELLYLAKSESEKAMSQLFS